MIVLGITGGLGSGKTTVAGIFRRLGAKVLDADLLAHEVMEPRGACFKRIVAIFGTAILTKARINRKKLARIVFNDPAALKTLEEIIHPQVICQMRHRITDFWKRKDVKCVAVDVPLLFESGFDKDMDLVIVVKARKIQQIDRTIRRLSLSRKDALKRMQRQMPLAEKINKADIIIDNSGSLAQTRRQVKLIWEGLVRCRKVSHDPGKISQHKVPFKGRNID